MFVKETRCDLCGATITQNDTSLTGSLKLKYKAKKSFEVYRPSYGIWSKWNSVDICPKCLDKIIRAKEVK